MRSDHGGLSRSARSWWEHRTSVDSSGPARLARCWTHGFRLETVRPIAKLSEGPAAPGWAWLLTAWISVSRPLVAPSSGLSKDRLYGTEVTDRPLGLALAVTAGLPGPLRITGVWLLIRFQGWQRFRWKRAGGRSAYKTGTGDVADAAGRAERKCQAAFRCRRTKSAVRCPSSSGLGSGSMCLSLSIAATAASGSSSWSLLLILLRMPRSFCMRE